MPATTVPHHGIVFEGGKIEAFCQRNGIRKLALFGSVLREDFGSVSDVDVLVEFSPDERVGFLRLMRIKNELEALLGVRNVDLRTSGDLSPYFRESVIPGAEVLYVCR